MSRDSVLIIDNKKNLFLLYILRYRNLNPNIFNRVREILVIHMSRVKWY